MRFLCLFQAARSCRSPQRDAPADDGSSNGSPLAAPVRTGSCIFTSAASCPYGLACRYYGSHKDRAEAEGAPAASDAGARVYSPAVRESISLAP